MNAQILSHTLVYAYRICLYRVVRHDDAQRLTSLLAPQHHEVSTQEVQLTGLLLHRKVEDNYRPTIMIEPMSNHELGQL